MTFWDWLQANPDVTEFIGALAFLAILAWWDKK